MIATSREISLSQSRAHRFLMVVLLLCVVATSCWQVWATENPTEPSEKAEWEDWYQIPWNEMVQSGVEFLEAGNTLRGIADLHEGLRRAQVAGVDHDQRSEILQVVAGARDWELEWDNWRSLESKAATIPSDERAFELELLLLASEQARVKPPAPVVRARLLDKLGRIFQSRYRSEESFRHFTSAMEIRRRELGEEHPDLAVSLLNFGAFYEDKFQLQGCDEDREKRESFVRAALEHRRKTLGAEDPLVAETLVALGSMFADQEQWSEAEKLYREALELQESTLDPWERPLESTLRALARSLEAQGKVREGQRFRARIEAVRVARRDREIRWKFGDRIRISPIRRAKNVSANVRRFPGFL